MRWSSAPLFKSYIEQIWDWEDFVEFMEISLLNWFLILHPRNFLKLEILFIEGSVLRMLIPFKKSYITAKPLLKSNIGPHPPTARVWDSTKWKIKVKFILLFRLFGAFYFFEEMSSFSDKIPCIYLGLWTPTHPPPPLFWDGVLKKQVFTEWLFSLRSLGLWTPTYP